MKRIFQFLLITSILGCTNVKSNFLYEVNKENIVSKEEKLYSNNENFASCENDNFYDVDFSISHESVLLKENYNIIIKLNYSIIYNGKYNEKLFVKIPVCERNVFYLEFFLTEEDVSYKWCNKDRYEIKPNQEIEVSLWSYGSFDKDIGREFGYR